MTTIEQGTGDEPTANGGGDIFPAFAKFVGCGAAAGGILALIVADFIGNSGERMPIAMLLGTAPGGDPGFLRRSK